MAGIHSLEMTNMRADRILQVGVRLITYVIAGFAVALLASMSLLPQVVNYKPYIVLSGSMAPSIPTGAVVFDVAVQPSQLKVGDVITYNRSDVPETVTHRIIDKGGDESSPNFVTKGDANPERDVWSVQFAPGTQAGKVVLSVPYVGYLYAELGSPIGRIVLLVVPVVVLTLMYLGQQWRARFNSRRKESELPQAMTPASDASSPARSVAPPYADPPSGPESVRTLPLRR